MRKESLAKGRYGVLGAAMLIQLCAGILYMWSVFQGPVTTHFGWEAAQVAMTGPLMMAMFVAGIWMGGRWSDLLGPRPVALAGSGLIALGMLLSSRLSGAQPWMLYLSYSGVGGLGVGVVYNTTISCVQRWFPDKRGMATGFTVFSFGFSLVVFSPLATYLLKTYGVPATFMSLGLLFLVLCGGASLWINNPPEGYAPVGYTPTAAMAGQKQYTSREMLRTRSFYFLTLSMMLITPAYFILNPLFKLLAMERGLSETMATGVVMITGIASASGRLLVPWLSDRIGRRAGLLAITAVTMGSILTLIVARGGLFVVCIAAIAFSFGASAALFAAFNADLFGTRYAGGNYGYVMIGFGLSAIVFPFISSRLAQSGDYTLSFMLAAATCILSGIFALKLKRPEAS